MAKGFQPKVVHGPRIQEDDVITVLKRYKHPVGEEIIHRDIRRHHEYTDESYDVAHVFQLLKILVNSGSVKRSFIEVEPTFYDVDRIFGYQLRQHSR